MYDARSSTRYRFLVAALTGAATVGSLTAAGLTTGAMARAAGGDAVTAGQESAGPAGGSAVRSTPVVRW